MPRFVDEAGNVWEATGPDDPNPVWVSGPQGQQGGTMVDPYQAPQAQAQVGQAQAGTRNTNASATVTEATTPTTVVRNDAPEGMMWVDPNNPRLGVMPIPNYSPPPSPAQAAEDRDTVNRLRELAGQINRVQQLFNEGPGTTSGLSGLQDYLSSDPNKAFNRAAAMLSDMAQAAFRIPGSGDVNQSEFQLMQQARSTDSWTRDVETRELLDGLRRRVDTRLQSLGQQPPAWVADAMAGGTQNGNGQNGGGTGGPGPSAMDQTVITAPATQMQASGERGTYGVPIPVEMQQRYRDWVLANGATMTPQSYSDFRNALNREFSGTIRERDSTRAGAGGFPESVPGAPIQFGQGDYTAEGQRIIDALKQGGGALNLTIPPVEVPLTESQASTDRAARNPAMAAMAGAANMGSFGGVEGLLGDQYNAMRDINGGYMLAGEALGALGPTSAISFLGRNTVGRFAPRLLNGGQLANLARGAAADATFSGIYGANTGQDPLTSAAIGGLASGVGGGLAKTLGAAGRGVAASAPVQAMRAADIPLTVGQTIGGVADRIEQRAMSIPVIGDMLRDRRIEGLQAFNQAALNEAGQPIGATVNAIGQEGLDQLGQQVSDAYTRATQGAYVPFDQQFATDFAAAMQQGQRLPRPERNRLGQVLDARLAPLTDVGSMTGDTYQQAMRGLSSARANPPQQFAGFEDMYRNAVTGAMDSLEGQMMRGGGQNVVQGLQAANAANRGFKTIEDAARRNIGGSNTDMPLVFTPNQLQRAGLRTQQNFPGPRPFASLADNAQQVLPQTIPNSGTADRAMQALLPSAILGGTAIGAGGGYASGGDLQSTAQGAGAGFAVPTALFLAAMAGSTKSGQRALSRAVTERNPTVRQFSDALLRRSGLFGSAAVPVLLPRN